MKAEEYLIYLKALKDYDEHKSAFEDKINREVNALIEQAMPQLIQGLRAYQGSRQIPQSRIYDILNKIVGDDLRKTYLEILQEIYVFGENQAIDKYNELTGENKPHIQFNMFKPDPKVLKLLKEHSFQASESTMLRVTSNVMRSLAESYEEGWGIDQAAEDLKKNTTGMHDWELKRIARTETNTTQNEGSFDNMKELGVEFHKWVTARDERVRPSSIGPDGKHRSKERRSKRKDGKSSRRKGTANHRKLDGEIVRLGEPFSNGLIRPGDRSAPMDEWINCRCTTAPYIMPLNKMAPPGKIQFKEIELVQRPKQVKGYTEFNRKSELYDYAEKNLKHDKGIYDSKGNLNAKGRQLEIYKERRNDWAYEVNKILRTAKTIEDIPKEFIKGIKLLDNAFTNKTIDKDIIVYRYMDPFEDLNQLKKEQVFPEKGYMSTTCSLDYASQMWDKKGRNGYIVRIRIPKGSNCIQMESALKYKSNENEGELLFPRGCSVLIKSIDHEKGWIECELNKE